MIMNPTELGKKYDKIAHWWHAQHEHSRYGLHALERALQWAPQGGEALDVGCGAGGRFIRRLQAQGFRVTGLDVSATMIQLARQQHPEHQFLQQDICHWQAVQDFDVIMAWDSLFHLPLSQQKPVLARLSAALRPGGVLMYSFGNAHGEHTDCWRDDHFYYSAIGINENVQWLFQQGLSLLHLELDQHPENHAYLIATRSQ